MSNFHHVVLVSWTEDATEAQISKVIEELAKLPGRIPQILHYQLGRDAKINEGNYDLAILAEFADVEAYKIYRDHPDHQTVIKNLIGPIRAARASVQYSV
jgi:Stress responsive A/B Barrel Domain